MQPIVYSPESTRAAYSNATSLSGYTHAGRAPRYTLLDTTISRVSLTHFEQETTKHVSRVDVYDYNDIQLTLNDGTTDSPKYIHWNTRIDYPRYAMRFIVKEMPDGSFLFDGSKQIVRSRGGGLGGLCFAGIMKAGNIDTEYGYRDIHKTAINGNVNRMRSIIENKVQAQKRYGVDVRDNLDQTAFVLALNYAVKYKDRGSEKYCEIMRMLLKAGAQVDMPNVSFHQPVVENICGSIGDLETLKLLVEKGVNVTHRTFRIHNWTPLHFAVSSDRDEIIKYLIGIGHEIDPVDQLGMTPLAYACKNERVKSIKALLELGADPDKIKPEHRAASPAVSQIIEANKKSTLDSLKQAMGIGSSQVIPITQ